MNKKIIIPVLAVFTVLMFGVCFWSIYSDIHFENQVTEREDAVKARLKQIRDAEDNYRFAAVSSPVLRSRTPSQTVN